MGIVLKADFKTKLNSRLSKFNPKNTRQEYHALLKEDGLWQLGSSRWALAKVLCRVLASIAPKWLRILKPGYNPRQVTDPAWGLAWAGSFSDNPEGVARLDTTRLVAEIPVPG